MRDDALLLGFGLGTFHAVMLTLGLLLPLYLTTDLGETLAGLSTAIGLAVFAALWGTSVYCTCRGISEAGLRSGQPALFGAVLRSGETWGAWNGVMFFWCLLVGGTVAVFASSLDEGWQAVPITGFVLIFGFGIGTVVSAFVGAATGTVFASIDFGLLWAARWVAGTGQRSMPTSRP
jgi:hypothetical protein